MKISFLSFTLLLTLAICNGQKVDKKCNLKEGKDEFTGVMTKSTQFESIGKIGTSVGEIKFKLSQNLPSDTIIRLYIQVTRFTDKTIDESSKIVILTLKGPINLKIIPLPTKRMREDSFDRDLKTVHTREFDVYTNISLEQIKTLKEYDIEEIRFYYFDDYDEFRIMNSFVNQYKYFVRTLPCFD
jgi:hypothetical protein